VILLEHIVVFSLTVGGPPYPRPWILAARFSQFAIMGLVFWRHRTHTLLPTSAAERQLWSIWIGYLIGCMIVSAINAQLHRADLLKEDLVMYPFWSVLAGLAFFAMGNSYWGRCYLLGVAFMVVAVLMPLVIHWSALLFGIMWAAALTSLGLQLR